MPTRKLTNALCRAGFVAGLLALITLTIFALTAQAVAKDELKRALLATVRLSVLVDGTEDEQVSGCGTVISADGHILTNYHIVGNPETGELFNEKGLASVAVNPADLKGLPVWTYEAEYVTGDPELDLAILKITAPFGGSGELPEPLGLIPIAMGDADTVEIADEVTVIGYPASGSGSVAFKTSAISGLLDADEDGASDWFTTDAPIHAGNSGGAAINEAGQLIGIPNPEADEAGAIRPLSLAMGLIKAGTVQVAVETPVTTTEEITPTVEIAVTEELEPVEVAPAVEIPPAVVITSTEEGGARITDLVFTAKIDRFNRAADPATVFGPQTKEIYAVFSYEGFEDGLTFDAVWLRDGQIDVTDSFEWAGGESGSYYISIFNERGVIVGDYNLTLSLDGVALATADIQVTGEGAAPDEPQFYSLRFAEGAESTAAGDIPVDVHEEDDPFEAETPKVYAFFMYRGMEDGMEWSRQWYLDDEEYAYGENEWDAGPDGQIWASLSADEGALPEGSYRLEMSIEGELAVEGEFVIGGGQLGEAALSNLVFAEGVTRDGRPIAVHDEDEPFESGTSSLYGFYDYSGMSRGTEVRSTWYLDDEYNTEGTFEWSGGESGTAWWEINNASDEGGPLADGKYELVLEIEGQGSEGATSGTFTIGDEAPVEDEGVWITGVVTDADTGRAIRGAWVVALVPGIDAASFAYYPDDQYIWAEAETNARGEFALDWPLTRGYTYSLIASAAGYDYAYDDYFEVTEDDPSLIELEVTLARSTGW